MHRKRIGHPLTQNRKLRNPPWKRKVRDNRPMQDSIQRSWDVCCSEVLLYSDIKEHSSKKNICSFFCVKDKLVLDIIVVCFSYCIYFFILSFRLKYFGFLSGAGWNMFGCVTEKYFVDFRSFVGWLQMGFSGLYWYNPTCAKLEKQSKIIQFLIKQNCYFLLFKMFNDFLYLLSGMVTVFTVTEGFLSLNFI